MTIDLGFNPLRIKISQKLKKYQQLGWPQNGLALSKKVQEMHMRNQQAQKAKESEVE
jgi:hypothetical protein